MNIIEERGVFWWSHDSSKEKEVTGLLKITDNGKISLHLDGEFCPESLSSKTIIINGEGILLEDEIIYGKLNKYNQAVSLFELRFFGILHIDTFQASHCLIGLDFGHNDFSEHLINPKCKQIDIPLDGFENWLFWWPIKRVDNDKEVAITYTIPDDDVYNTDDAEIRITYYPKVSSESYGQCQTLRAAADFIYKPYCPTNLKRVENIFRYLQDLLILLTNSEYCLNKWPVLTLSHNDKKYRFYYWRYTNSANKLDQYEIPIYFDRIKSSFGEIFSLWMKQSELLGSAFYSFLSTKRGVMLYIEDHFRALVGGLEAYHRKTVENPPISKKLQDKIDRILGQIELRKDKEWLSDHVIKRAHINEPPLSDRLFSVITYVQPHLDKEKIRNFTHRCASIRNDLSHYAGQRDSNNNTLFYQELVRINDALSYLYHALILTDIGVDKALIEKWFNDSMYSYRIKKALENVGLIDIPSKTQ